MAEKRRASGRARDAKRRRTSTKPATATTTPKAATPALEATPVQEVEPVREATPLPNKVVESRPLPTLSEPQSLDVSKQQDYRTIAESGVLLASLDRSRQKWLSGTFLEKYWTKTSGRKDAPPPPPGNPHKSWMKEIGPCTIVVEPLVFDATAYYVKEPGPAPPQPPAPQQHFQQHQPYHHQYQPRPPPTPAQHTPAGSPYGTPYSTPTTQHPGRPTNYPPSAHPHQPTNTPDQRGLPPIMPATAQPHPPPPPPPAQPQAPAKQSPDPVIQMLASRASSNAELKALMKIVATGNANQEQLRIFQRHIDELTAMINANKAQGASQAPSPAPPYAHPPSRPPSITPAIKPHPATTSQHPPIYPMSHQPQHQPPPPPRYPSYPIVLEFQGQGASPDRFRFPENAILEFLTPFKMLASFLVIRKGSDIGAQLEADTEYYEPVTITVNVPEGRTAARDVLQYINRSVKPADQVRKWMIERIEKCMRTQRRYLAYRLPQKSGIVETEEVPVMQEVKPKPRPAAPRKKKEEKEGEQAGGKEAGKSADKEISKSADKEAPKGVGDDSTKDAAQSGAKVADQNAVNGTGQATANGAGQEVSKDTTDVAVPIPTEKSSEQKEEKIQT